MRKMENTFVKSDFFKAAPRPLAGQPKKFGSERGSLADKEGGSFLTWDGPGSRKEEENDVIARVRERGGGAPPKEAKK